MQEIGLLDAFVLLLGCREFETEGIIMKSMSCPELFEGCEIFFVNISSVRHRIILINIIRFILCVCCSVKVRGEDGVSITEEKTNSARFVGQELSFGLKRCF